MDANINGFSIPCIAPVSDSETGGTSSSQLSGAVIAVAVLGVLLGLVLIGGTVVLIIFIVYRYRPTANKEILSALQGQQTLMTKRACIPFGYIPSGMVQIEYNA